MNDGVKGIHKKIVACSKELWRLLSLAIARKFSGKSQNMSVIIKLASTWPGINFFVLNSNTVYCNIVFPNRFQSTKFITFKLNVY
jgi:hypothetical protein